VGRVAVLVCNAAIVFHRRVDGGRGEIRDELEGGRKVPSRVRRGCVSTDAVCARERARWEHVVVQRSVLVFVSAQVGGRR
jgi:hypothetical protein